MIQLVIGSDHRGFELKSRLLRHFSVRPSGLGPESSLSRNAPLDNILDIGCFSSSTCDYPDICAEMSKKIDGFGVLICNTGIGMSIAANRFKNIRAALCFNSDIAILSRQHNNANVVVIGAKYTHLELSIEIIQSFINTPFDEKYSLRVKKIDFFS